MKAIDIIDALTRMGSTEDCGVLVAPENCSEIEIFFRNHFVGDDETTRMIVDGSAKPEASYLYRYDERISRPSGEQGADIVLTLYEFAHANPSSIIYLYEIE